MSSRFLEGVRLTCMLALLACCSRVESRDLVVCADPDNLPFSHQDGSGFENRIAELVAQDLRARLVYRWLPLRRGVVRKTLGARLCDVLMGVPADPARRRHDDSLLSIELCARHAHGLGRAGFDRSMTRASARAGSAFR